MDLKFLKSCQIKGILPKFTRFKLANNKLNKAKETNEFRIKILELEIKNKKRNIRHFKKEQLKNYNYVFFELSYLDQIVFKEYVKTLIKTSKVKTIKIQNKKLDALQFKNKFDILKNLENELKDEQLKLSDTIVNLSKRKLTEIEERVLNKGLSFGIKGKELNNYEIITKMELLAQRLDKVEIKEDTEKETNFKINSKESFLHNLQ